MTCSVPAESGSESSVAEAADHPSFAYRLFGLRLSSALPLPALVDAQALAEADVIIRIGRLPVQDERPPGYSLSQYGTVLTVPHTARFLIRNGSEILVEPATGASERNVRIFLLGSAIGAILHQRGMLPLHANAVEVDGRIIAFCGRSGAGKSTLAAWFHDRGHRILSDDVCVVSFDQGPAIVHPGLPRLRLWRDALLRTGRSADEFEPSFDEGSKFDVPTRLHTGSEARPLHHIYLLGGAPELPLPPVIERLRGAGAVDALVSNTYRGGYVRLLGRVGDHLQACVRLAGTVPVFVVNRLWGHAEFDAQARQLQEHARKQEAGICRRGSPDE